MVVLPKVSLQGMNPDQVLQQSAVVFRRLLESRHSEKAWPIFDLRYGFISGDNLTFEQMGEHYDVTRQRIHQIHLGNLSYIRAVLFENKKTPGFSLHPEWLSLVRNIHDQVGRIASKPCLETTILSELSSQLKITRLHPFINVSYDLHGIKRLEHGGGLDAICGIFPLISEQHHLLRVVTAIDHILTHETAQPLEDMELFSVLVKAKLGKGLTPIKLIQTSQLCSSVEILPDKKLWGLFEHLSHLSKVERILLEEGLPLSSSEIYRRISQRLAKADVLVPGKRNLFNQISQDKRFESIGKGGWKLSSWSDVDSSSIVALMIRCLQGSGTPLRSNEIYEYVVKKRRVQPASIIFYLGTRAEFKKIGFDRWGLTDWRNSDSFETKSWNPEEVANFVSKFFRDQHLHEIEYIKLRCALETATGLSPRQVNGIFSTNPVIKKYKNERGTLIAVYQPDYEVNLQKKKPRFGKVTMEHKLRQSTIEFLRSQPAKEATLQELIRHLGNLYNRPYQTVYTYIGRMAKEGLVERVAEDGTRKVRLKSRFNAGSFHAISKIQSLNRRDRVTRAMEYLNPEEVDIGLFQLGKTFESTLKAYLKLALTRGKITCTNLSLTKLDEWKLATMIECVWSAHIITDKSTFSFLRQERNERAHGEMPSSEELNVIWQGVEQLAGMYVQAIQLFDNLIYQLEKEDN